ncbi:hypothetical protein GOL81_25220 [Sinorhizobium medicae]|uniref:hypothetical protein n=1 Tax=Sinorhizobium medicae TaxID=110321 RepID=UPI00139C6CAD|nr:hypothetical protein [Sinorhizobium medicae]MDX1102649.1 hypothetical protein [Sinorhizobium medicae]MQV48227.1 hypothetical protein [Sinorhizobium medicae]MQV53839.1 hypothetical protein [Sinorhizobium medicae]MQV71485.1 hypothetical protein [Sinorhizobium medicae]
MSKAQADPCVFYCEHPGCKKWGSFGFAVGRGEPNWFCSEHQPEWTSHDETKRGRPWATGEP